MQKLLFGSDFPFTTPSATLKALKELNHMVDGTNLPRISETLVDEMIHRDSLKLLFER